MLIVKQPGSGINPGQWIRLVMIQSGPEQTTVRIYSRAVIAIHGLSSRDFSDSIFATITVKLGLPVPASPAPSN
jgi:hypothetical protein